MTTSKELIEKIALRVTRAGTDKINFQILEMANNDGMNINKLIEETKLTKVPINVRVNKLERVGLVKRWRGTGSIVITDFGKDFMKLIYGYQEVVRSNVIDILKKTYDV